jgi:hypothetical protein
VKDIFGAMHGRGGGAGGGTSSSSSHAHAGGGERVTVQEEIYTRSDGLRIVRRTVTTVSPDGGVRRDVTERVVGEGGPFGSGGWESRGRAPPPPGSGGRGVDPTAGGATRGHVPNPLSQMGGVAGQVAKAFAAQMASRVARRGVEVILQAIMRSVFRR